MHYYGEVNVWIHGKLLFRYLDIHRSTQRKFGKYGGTCAVSLLDASDILEAICSSNYV